MGEPPGADRDMVAGRGRKRGIERTWEMLEDAGMRCGAKNQAAEASKCQVGTTSRWTAYRSGRGGGERVHERGGKQKDSEKWLIQVGREG